MLYLSLVQSGWKLAARLQSAHSTAHAQVNINQLYKSWMSIHFIIKAFLYVQLYKGICSSKIFSIHMKVIHKSDIIFFPIIKDNLKSMPSCYSFLILYIYGVYFSVFYNYNIIYCTANKF